MTRNASSKEPTKAHLFTGGSLLVIGLLLWARLILVTNHPKTAIAEPQVTEETHDVDSDAKRENDSE